jgi:hypothetical protein
VNLCGVPLSRICLPNNSKHYPRKNKWKHFDTLTYMYTLLGFASGFSIVCLTLISSAATRKAYFQFANGVLHKLHTATDMKAPYQQDVSRTRPVHAYRKSELHYSLQLQRAFHCNLEERCIVRRVLGKPDANYKLNNCLTVFLYTSP